MTEVIFRKAERADYQPIITLYQSVISHMNDSGIAQWDEIYPSEELIKADVESGQSFLSYIGKEMCSVAVMNEQQEPEYTQIPWEHCNEKVCVIHRLCVHPKWQRQGIAKSAMLYLEEIARLQGYKSIRLDAFAKNPAARALYRSLGYKHVGNVTFRKGRFLCFEKLITRSGEDDVAKWLEANAL
jgi:ribosomal protein S18 acetylase RimI-like enzyme